MYTAENCGKSTSWIKEISWRDSRLKKARVETEIICIKNFVIQWSKCSCTEFWKKTKYDLISLKFHANGSFFRKIQQLAIFEDFFNLIFIKKEKLVFPMKEMKNRLKLDLELNLWQVSFYRVLGTDPGFIFIHKSKITNQ